MSSEEGLSPSLRLARHQHPKFGQIMAEYSLAAVINMERNMAMETGMKFIEEKNLSKNTKITKIFNGGEPEEFKSLFVDWN